MSGKILIAYASKTNATADYAGFIAGELIARGFQVEQMNLRATGKSDLGGYSLVILGTGVRIGRWYGPAKKLLKRNELGSKPLAIFVSCGMAIEPDKRGESIQLYIDKMLDKYQKKTISKAAFPGKMPGSKVEMVIDAELVRAWVNEILMRANLTS